jgi:hypothetical protein
LIEKATRKTSKTVVSDIESRVQDISPYCDYGAGSNAGEASNTIRNAHNDFDEIIKSGDVQNGLKSNQIL